MSKSIKHISSHSSFSGWRFLMLTCCLLLLANIAGLRAQTNGEYNLSNNYWGGLDPNFTASTNWPSFNFITPVSILTDPTTFSGVSCGGLDMPLKKKGAKPQGSLQNTSWDSCSIAYGWGQIWEGNSQESKPAYDTMHWYLQHCYSKPNSASGWPIFMAAASEVTMHGSDPSGLMTEDSLLQLRSWIMSERHLNPADGWYCYCIATLPLTWPGDIPVELSILKFLIDNPRCSNGPGYGDTWGKEYSHLRGLQYGAWLQTVWTKDNNAVFDTTLPPFNDIGLDSLLADAAAGVHYEALGPQIILDAHITANPFPQQTSISITTNREAYIHVEVFDLLGRKLAGVGYAGTFEPGTREVPLDLSQAPSGTYYLRLSTANNETRTMKLSKE